MRTTIALDSTYRDQLVALKQRWGLASLEEVMATPLDGPPATAEALDRRRQRTIDRILKRHAVSRMLALGSRDQIDAPWRAIRGMSKVPAHQYGAILHAQAHTAALRDLPQVIDRIERHRT